MMKIDEVRRLLYEDEFSVADIENITILTLALLDYYATHGRHCTSGNCGVCRGCTAHATVERLLEASDE